MSQTVQIIFTSINQAFQELRVNRLRTFLSLLGITIGIFCIIAVLTVLDSMENNIQKEVSTLGSDVLYINRWPWMDEGGQYKWWEYWRRPSMNPAAMKAVQTQIPDVEYASLSFPTGNLSVKHYDIEVGSVSGYAVMPYFDKLQNIEIASGRYLSPSELDGGANSIILGATVYKQLFPTGGNAIGNNVNVLGKKFIIVGVMKKVGQNMAGFEFDNAVVFPYYAAASIFELSSLDYDPMLIIKARNKNKIDEVKYEVEGVLRRLRKVRPGLANDFSVNQLSQISQRLETLFSSINVIGWVIAAFSLTVGAFGIANIMFVTVKERTRIIGLKKAIGARSRVILTEFLAEAVALCLIGGLIGIFIVLILSWVLTYGADFPVTLSSKNFFIGITVSAVVGILAGYIPARAASRLDPVVAIRST
jgi:putative ABC transport system permease protein